MARKKISWLLILQGWGMLWVVIGHAPLKLDNSMPAFAKVLYDIAYSFHMPLFIMLSGYLFYMTRLLPSMQSEGGWTYKSIIMDKLMRLGIPFVVFTVIAMLMKVLFPGEVARQASFTLGEFVRAILYPRDGPLLEMWFVAVIMWMFALSPWWKLCLRSKWLSFVTMIIMFLLHIGAEYLPFGSFLGFRDTAAFAIYFYIGMIACKYGFDNRNEPYKYVMMVLSVVMYLSCRYLGFTFGTAMSGIAFSVGLSFVLDKYFPMAFYSFRNYTYQIFLMSIFVQIAIKVIYSRIAMTEIAIHYPVQIYVLFFLICLTMGLYVPVLVSKLAEQLNWAPILLTIGLKKK